MTSIQYIVLFIVAGFAASVGVGWVLRIALNHGFRVVCQQAKPSDLSQLLFDLAEHHGVDVSLADKKRRGWIDLEREGLGTVRVELDLPSTAGNAAKLELRVVAQVEDVPGGNHPYRGAPPKEIGAEIAVAEVRCRRETDIDRVAKSLRLSREVQTGDESFDQQVYLDSDASDELIGAALAPERVRRPIAELLRGMPSAPATGYEGVALFREARPVLYHTNPQLEHLAPEAVQWAIDQLGRISGALPEPRGTRVRRGLSKAGWLSWCSGITMGISFFVIAGVWGPHFPRTATGGLWLACFAAWVVVFVVIATIVRGRSNSLITLVGAGLGHLIAVGGFVYGAGALINLKLDDSAGVVHHTTVVKYERDIYYVRSWRDDETAVWLPERLLDGAKELPVEAAVDVRTHPGFLGMEWIEWLRPAAGQQADSE